MKFEVGFTKIGRRDFNPSLDETIRARDYDDLASKVEKIAKKYLASKGVDVDILANGNGEIYAGDRFVGNFTWKEV